MRHSVFIFMIMSLLGCQPKYVFNSDGGIRPKKDNFFSYRKKPFHLKDTVIIDTNSIYVRDLGLIFWPNSSGGTDSVAHNYVRYRFFATGQVHLVSTDTFPGAKEAGNIKGGAVGYYKIRKNKILIQKLTAYGTLVKEVGTGENGDLLIRERTLTGRLNKSKRFRKIKVAGVENQKPDW